MKVKAAWKTLCFLLIFLTVTSTKTQGSVTCSLFWLLLSLVIRRVYKVYVFVPAMFGVLFLIFAEYC